MQLTKEDASTDTAPLHQGPRQLHVGAAMTSQVGQCIARPPPMGLLTLAPSPSPLVHAHAGLSINLVEM